MDISKLNLNKSDKQVLIDFENYLIVILNLSKNSVSSYLNDVEKWLEYCSSNNFSALSAKTLDVQKFYQNVYGDKMAINSAVRSFSSLQNFYSFLQDNELAIENPLENMARPKKTTPLPSVLSYEEVDRLLKAPDLNSKFGIRDRAILETMYAAGLRVSETTSLKLDDLHLSMHLINVVGKGNVERIVPLNDEAIHFINLYFKEIRDKINKSNSNFVFLNYQGNGISRQSIWKLIKKYLQIAGIDKKVTPHTLRHSFATHLISNGADLRSVQELLGHQNVSTTQIYTHIANNLLLKVYNEAKPRK
ncbi:site-specific tyrosine recombinase XerD [Xylocopilactobacillus apis]|uniref:Tyrosine recombinase XerC n=1 Tax=Xylocopilactobacillus apis TaxID=2932183 RepID=A0AAU9CZ76_9LACO|nr:site-specific tyrosine recombinase XerD [Xylocopilactobacillus apis]BDR56548.1 tyrosine recombinase XerD [Xylocopilactobacillus apis]